MNAKQLEIEALRELARHCRTSARVAREHGLTWEQAWEMHLECTRQMTADPARYHDAVCDMVSRGGTGEEFAAMLDESAADHERKAAELEAI